MADGGDGTLDVLVTAIGGSRQPVAVSGPLGSRQSPVQAEIGWLHDRDAVVEMASAAGLHLLDPSALSSLSATSRGLGELIATAVDAGATRIVIGVGGSACTDGGAGALAALGVELVDVAGDPIPDGGEGLARLARIDAHRLHPGLARCRLEIACDVSAPLTGPEGAAHRFAAQKGATPDDILVLDQILNRFSAIVEADLGRPRSLVTLPGAGAAGGTGYGLAAVCGARLQPGAAVVADMVGLDASLDGCVLCITGEGRLDAASTAGKAPGEVLKRAQEAGVPCVALVGGIDTATTSFAEVVAIGEGLATTRAIARTAELLEEHAAAVARRWLSTRR